MRPGATKTTPGLALSWPLATGRRDFDADGVAEPEPEAAGRTGVLGGIALPAVPEPRDPEPASLGLAKPELPEELAGPEPAGTESKSNPNSSSGAAYMKLVSI